MFALQAATCNFSNGKPTTYPCPVTKVMEHFARDDLIYIDTSSRLNLAAKHGVRSPYVNLCRR
jgi:hypothetical protein